VDLLIQWRWILFLLHQQFGLWGELTKSNFGAAFSKENRLMIGHVLPEIQKEKLLLLLQGTSTPLPFSTKQTMKNLS
jgi:hypothetical protein